jgi:tetratricopeptide (TPR) repeat protein
MARLFGGVGGDGDSALERAQEVMYEAWETDDRRRRAALAREALTISADCADAYALLSAEANDPAEARRLLEQAVAAGERALGQEYFDEHAGHFWGLLETRPYMRARESLAQMLWAQGEREAAVAHYLELLRLNPGDNQGVRGTLVPRLLALGRDEDAAKILAQYPKDTMAWMSYSRVLLAYRQEGNGTKARELLRAAIKHNAYVPAYLLGRKNLPKTLPVHYGFGDDNEAVFYVHDSAANWSQTPGALEWLASSVTK